jgi:hypothetical protein
MFDFIKRLFARDAQASAPGDTVRAAEDEARRKAKEAELSAMAEAARRAMEEAERRSR